MATRPQEVNEMASTINRYPEEAGKEEFAILAYIEALETENSELETKARKDHDTLITLREKLKRVVKDIDSTGGSYGIKGLNSDEDEPDILKLCEAILSDYESLIYFIELSKET